jgi:hypothetical protein
MFVKTATDMKIYINAQLLFTRNTVRAVLSSDDMELGTRVGGGEYGKFWAEQIGY